MGTLGMSLEVVEVDTLGMSSSSAGFVGGEISSTEGSD
jgi:hypothetical protein